jgi:carboxyl-terminal processing protease
MNRTEKGLVITVFILWSALMVGAGYVGRMVISPIEFRTERVYGTGNANALFDEAWMRVRDNFIGTVPSDTVRTYGAIRGALATLDDRYTIFTEPKAHSIERDHMRGSFGGIGVNFSLSDRGQIVLAPMRDGPAARAGVRDGDILTGIDGEKLPESATFDDVARIRGEVGTPVTIEVLRGDDALTFTIVREVIEVRSVDWRTITATLQDASPALVGYIRINSFTERTGKEVQEALRELKSQNSQAYLIDLRDNPGGLLTAAVDVASEFLPDGVVVFEKKRDAPESSFRVKTGQAKILGDEPVAVLVNGSTASAAEIVAAALQDHDRGTLVGVKSYGKGSVQLIFDLADGSAVRVTTAKWLTPDRRELDGVGLEPDVVVEGEADAQMQKAVDVLSRAISAP